MECMTLCRTASGRRWRTLKGVFWAIFKSYTNKDYQAQVWANIQGCRKVLARPWCFPETPGQCWKWLSLSRWERCKTLSSPPRPLSCDWSLPCNTQTFIYLRLPCWCVWNANALTSWRSAGLLLEFCRMTDWSSASKEMNDSFIQLNRNHGKSINTNLFTSWICLISVLFNFTRWGFSNSTAKGRPVNQTYKPRLEIIQRNDTSVEAMTTFYRFPESSRPRPLVPMMKS